MKIINSKDKAMNSKHWHDPGAKLYDAIKDSESALEEAYLIVGDTGKDVPYSRSGCKYPHHSINDDGDLVVNIDGVIAAYGRAKQMGIFKGEVKSHLMRHYKELGLYKGSKMEKDETITENFEYIESVLGIDEELYMVESVDDSSIEELESWIDNAAHGEIYTDFDIMNESAGSELNSQEVAKVRDIISKIIKWMDNPNDTKLSSMIMPDLFSLCEIVGISQEELDKRVGPKIDQSKYESKLLGKLMADSDWGVEVFDKEYGPCITLASGLDDHLIYSAKKNTIRIINFEHSEIYSVDDNGLPTSLLDYFNNESEDEIHDIVNNIYDELTTESTDIMYMFTEADENERWLPVYGVSTAASLGKLRNTGEKKTKDEMDSVGTRKLLSTISNGDHYNHILLSFNDDLTEMYSFNNHGIVKESIMDPTRWQSTESIYIAVMFFKESDWKKMHDTCIDWVKNDRSATKYAYSDLIKLFFSKPIKKEKRFLCSSFAGYILSMGGRKMLNKDYQRMRPEDLTILPRSFYVMSVKDRDDFIARKSEFKAKVQKIYDEHIEEVEEYNNDLPKIMLKDEMGKLKSFDKLIAWIFSKFAHAPDTVTESTDIMDMFTEADENDPPELTDENQEDSKPEESSEVPNPDEVPTPPEETSTEQPAKEQPSEEPTEEPPSAEEEPAETEEQPEAPKEEPEKPMSMPKQTDAAEKGKNGVRRKKLYIAFIEWCKAYNNKNTFGSIFDKDIFHNVYPFVPEELRYFYRLANPILCVLGGELTFFQVSELRKVNKNNKDLSKQLIFAATQQDLRVFNNKDKKVYLATEENGAIQLGQVLGDTFDTYIQNMIKQGDILNAPLEGEEVEE